MREWILFLLWRVPRLNGSKHEMYKRYRDSGIYIQLYNMVLILTPCKKCKWEHYSSVYSCISVLSLISNPASFPWEHTVWQSYSVPIVYRAVQIQNGWASSLFTFTGIQISIEQRAMVRSQISLIISTNIWYINFMSSILCLVSGAQRSCTTIIV